MRKNKLFYWCTVIEKNVHTLVSLGREGDRDHTPDRACCVPHVLDRVLLSGRAAFCRHGDLKTDNARWKGNKNVMDKTNSFSQPDKKI